MSETKLNGTEYGIEGLIFEIKQGATWRETFLFEGDLSSYTFRGYIARERGGERLAEFSFSNPSFGNFTDEDGDPLTGFTSIAASIPFGITEDIPLTPTKVVPSPKAGRDYWEADIECVSGNGAIVIPLVSAIVYVRGQC